MVGLYNEFSVTAAFDYDDSLPDRFVFLREKVLADGCVLLRLSV